jgi:ubiquinone/menaquinone biosynthesis C-methylase UbiE
MSQPSPSPAATPPNPLATAEPWDTVSAAYTQELLPLFELFSRDALNLSQLPANPRVVDVAAGPGTLSIMAALGGAKVSAIDFSPAMVAAHKTRAAEKSVGDRIEVVEGDGQHLPFASESYDAAFSMFGLIFFPDRVAGFREMRRVIKPGRRAIVSSWAPFEGAFGILMDAVRANLPGMPFGQGQAPLGKPEDYHREMKEAGFAGVKVETLKHSLNAASVEAFWEHVQRTNVAVILARRKVGEEQWKTISPGILGQLKKELGEGSVSVSARAYLGIGTR